MEKLIIEKIYKNKKWYEKINIRIFKKSYIETYKIGVKECFNNLVK